MSFESFKSLTPGLVVFLLASLGSIIFPSWPAAFIMLVGLVSYAVERGDSLFRDVTEEKKHDLNMVMLQNQIEALQKDHDAVKRVAEETKNMINAAKLSNSILPKSMRAGFGGN